MFHFFTISEIHGILLALFKEIERSMRNKIKEKYEEDDKTFFYFLTDSNYYDSSQINLNYFSLYLIRMINTKYNTEIIYTISIFVLLQ